MPTKKNSTRRQNIFKAVLCVECYVLAAGILTAHHKMTLQAQTLSDVSVSSYGGQAAIYLQKRNIISGFPDGTFRGGNPVNRVEAAKMLLLAADYTLTHQQNDGRFPDIERGSWYEQFALNAVQNGLMNGYPDGTFGPARTVLRSEFLKMLSNAFQLDGGTPYHFTDVPEDAWFAKYTGDAEKFNLFLHDKAQLLPSAPMSREEVSWAIYQMLIFRANNIVIRTPFDYQHTGLPRVPTDPLHAAPITPPPSSSSAGLPIPIPTVSSSAPVSSAAPTVQQTFCDDSDQTQNFPNGFNENTRGVARNLLMTTNNQYEDVCVPNTNILYEYYCNEQGYLAREKINCPIFCDEGACSVEGPETPEEIDPRRPTGTLSSSSSSSQVTPPELVQDCTDTDSTHRFQYGDNFFAKGTVNGLLPNLTRAAFTDVCVSATNLREFYCQLDGLIAEVTTPCPLGCNDSACISPGTTGTCSDTDELDFTTVGRIYVDHPEEGNFTDEDYCESQSFLNEYICGTDGRVGRYLQDCNCQDGICID